LALGVGAIAGIGTLSAALVEGLQSQGRELLGGDVELTLTQRPATAIERQYLERLGPLSEVVSLRAMAYAPGADDRALVELRAVDRQYPLYGAVKLKGDLVLGQTLAQALGQKGGFWGIAVSPDLAVRLNLKRGDKLVLGEVTYDIRAFLEHLPEGGLDGLELAPPVLVDARSLAATGLIGTGSLMRHYYRLKLPPEASLAGLKNSLETAFPEAGWRWRDRNNGAPGVREFVERMSFFLTMVGLTALVVGGVGVGNAVNMHLERRIAAIATLKTLGATGRQIFAMYMTGVAMIGAIGVFMGVVLGALLPVALGGLLAGKLPVLPAIGFYPRPLLLAAAYGFLVMLVFSVWPLARLKAIPAAALYRRMVSGKSGWPRWPYILFTAAASSLLAGIILAFSGNMRFAGGFILAAAGSIALLAATGLMVRKAAARAPRSRRPGLRLALANLHRPGAATGVIILSLGLGLTLFAAIVQIEGNLSARIKDQLPEEAPAFFFIDIQKDQMPRFEKTALGLEGVSGLDLTPYLRGRITGLKDQPVNEAAIAPDARWAVQDDRGLTFAAELPKGNVLTAGSWWPKGYAGPPQISLDAKLAEGMGLKLGDSITVNVLGLDVRARIASLRQIDWGTLGMNFAIIFDPHTLMGTPYTYLAALKVNPAREALVHKSLGKAFPNVSAVRMRDVLATVNRLLIDIGAAVRLAATLTILSGILVLAGAVAAGQRQRLYDAVILKILGATRRDILSFFIIEYVLLGFITALIALGLGTLGAFVVVTQVMNMPWAFTLTPVLAVTAASLMLTVSLGMIGSWAALRQRPATALREV
jgi:putative ABC transport system permease protein